MSEEIDKKLDFLIGEVASMKGNLASMEERLKYDMSRREQKLELQLQQVINRPSNGIDGMGFVEG